jgi:hypothetical protein
MNTFNNLALPVTVSNWQRYKPEWGKSDSTDLAMRKLAQLGLIWPEMVQADKRKLKGYRTALASAITSAENHLANSSHHVQSKGEWVKKDRIGSLLNAIAKLEKLNPGVLKGGLRLKSEMIEMGWLVYAKLEVLGQDNAHYRQSDLPCDDRQTDRPSKAIGLTFHGKRKLPKLADSKLSPEQQWQALAIADLFGHKGLEKPQPKQVVETAPFVGPVKPTKPRPTTSRIKPSGYTPEIVPANPPLPEWDGSWQFVYADGTRTDYQF